MSFSASVKELVSKSDNPLVAAHADWLRIPLGQVAKIINGFPLKSDFFDDKEGTPVIRIRDVTAGYSTTFYTGSIPEGFWVEPGDIVIGMDGDFNSRIWQAEKALLNQRVCKLVPDATKIDTRFLAYLLPGYLQLINNETHSITVKHLSSKTIAEIPIPLPPLAEQRRIVARLDALLGRAARARAELARVPALAERQRQAVLAKAFQGELTEEWRNQKPDLETAKTIVDKTSIPSQPRGGREAADRIIPGIAALSVNNPGTKPPDKWHWVPLHRVARQETGHTPSRSHPEWWDGDIPWIGIRDASLYHGKTIFDTIQKTNASGLENSAARLLPAGTVCLSRTASIGYIVIMGKDMATSQDFVTWTCNSSLLPKYLMYALMAEGEQIRRFGKGSTHTTIYFPEVRALHICLAPLEEQAEIVRRIESAFARIDKAAAEAARAAELLERLEQATLARAFRGEL